MAIVLTFLSLLILNGCSPSETIPKPKLFIEQRTVLDQAKAVDDSQQQQVDEQRKLIEKQTQ